LARKVDAATRWVGLTIVIPVQDVWFVKTVFTPLATALGTLSWTFSYSEVVVCGEEV
jgi:hypothetical protein